MRVEDGSPTHVNDELWRSDGTVAGTFKARDINPDPGRGSSPADITPFIPAP
jgi:ELWxxDGT repeat protein